MASKLDSIPTSYSEAVAYLGDRPFRACGNNTSLLKLTGSAGGEDIALILHSTPVVTYQANGVSVLRTGGYRTVTTKDRLNRALRGSGYRVFAKDYQWFVRLPDGRVLAFCEGFTCPVGGGTQAAPFEVVGEVLVGHITERPVSGLRIGPLTAAQSALQARVAANATAHEIRGRLAQGR